MKFHQYTFKEGLDMYSQKEKPNENKSKAISNFVGQKNNRYQQSFGFWDNRPKEKSQKGLQLMMNKYAQIENPKETRIKALTIQKTRMLGKVQTIQRKPNDIDQQYPIVLDAEGKSTNEKGTRKNTSYAAAINSLVTKSSFDSNVELIGGHLHKREYGGEDNDTNVVPWKQECEEKYSDDFEKKYEAKFFEHKSETVTLSAKATFADKNLNLLESDDWKKEPDSEILDRKKAILSDKLKPIKEALERIPTTVKTSCIDQSFDASGTGIAPNYALSKDKKDSLLKQSDTAYTHKHKDKNATHMHTV